MKIRKFLAVAGILLAVLTGLYFALGQESEASFSAQTSFPKKEMTSLQKEVPVQLKDLNLAAKSAVLLDAETGRILYEEEMDVPLPIASMSKIMTELLVLEAVEKKVIGWDDRVTPSPFAMTVSETPGLAAVQLEPARDYSVRELFEAMAVHSANDAAIALAEKVAGSEREFVIRMNKKAKELGLEKASFVNSSGLNNEDLGDFYSTGEKNETNIMTAKELARLSQHLLASYPEILDITEQPQLSFGAYTYANTNLMLPAANDPGLGFDGVDGLKTGFTDEAGYCFAGTVQRNDTRLISVVIGTPTIQARFAETKRLYEEAFAAMGI